MKREESTRRLIVNADDFGISAGVNRGIIEAHEHGIVTSASLMTRWPAAAAAAEYARGRPGLSVGLHLDLGEWTFADGAWRCVYEVVRPERRCGGGGGSRAPARRLCRAAWAPSVAHRSHQHVHRDEPVRSAALAAARRLGVPVRHFCAEVAYCGAFYGQSAKGEAYPEGISVEGLARAVRGLPPGITELGCHAGYGRDLDSMYRLEREQEVRTLCDPRVREVLAAEGVVLQSFRQVHSRAVDPPTSGPRSP